MNKHVLSDICIFFKWLSDKFLNILHPKAEQVTLTRYLENVM